MNGVNSQIKLNKAAPEQDTWRKWLLTHYNELLKITDGRSLRRKDGIVGITGKKGIQ